MSDPSLKRSANGRGQQARAAEVRNNVAASGLAYCRPVTFRASVTLIEDKLVTVTAWHLLLFVTANFVSSFFRGRRRVFMSMSRTRTGKRSFG